VRSFLTMLLACSMFTVSATATDAAVYGALATTSTYPAIVYGYSADAATLGRAEAIALAGCRVHTRFACFVRVWFVGAGMCGAVARLGAHQGWGYARGIVAARLVALRAAGGGLIVATACNGI